MERNSRDEGTIQKGCWEPLATHLPLASLPTTLLTTRVTEVTGDWPYQYSCFILSSFGTGYQGVQATPSLSSLRQETPKDGRMATNEFCWSVVTVTYSINE